MVRGLPRQNGARFLRLACQNFGLGINRQAVGITRFAADENVIDRSLIPAAVARPTTMSFEQRNR